MSTEHIAFMDWTVIETSRGRMYVNTTDEITGIAVWDNPTTFSYVVMVEGETSPRKIYDNKEYSSWNVSNIWNVLSNLGEAMYDVESDLMDEAEDTMYTNGLDYDDTICDDDVYMTF